MISMTGYGASEYQDERIQISVEFRSYNNRYLEISYNAPFFANCLEQEVKESIKSTISRGHVDMNLRIKVLESDVEFIVDENLVVEYTKALERIIEAAGLDRRPRLSDYLHNDDILKLVRHHDIGEFHDLILEQVNLALVPFCESRAIEGERTMLDIQKNLSSFQAAFHSVIAQAASIETMIQENLVGRFKQLLESNYDENRVLQEVAVMLMKYTINEEINRVETHLAQFREDMESGQSVGKRLDFLCQELNREVNTIGSKSIIAEVNQAVVVMKESLENIREQLRNVE